MLQNLLQKWGSQPAADPHTNLNGQDIYLDLYTLSDQDDSLQVADSVHSHQPI
jgi:hypothetical protein